MTFPVFLNSVVRLAAMSDAEDAHGVLVESEQHAVVADSDPIKSLRA